MPVEYGIGYEGTFSRYRAFESYSHMHMVWGKQSPTKDVDGKFYDVVIPNYFDPASTHSRPREERLLSLSRPAHQAEGRQHRRRDLQASGVELKIAGQGVKEIDRNRIVCTDGEVYEGDNLEYMGCVIGNERAKLFQEAKGVFVPTTYVEPFGGVAVERSWPAPPSSPRTGVPLPRPSSMARPATVAARSIISSLRQIT